MISIGCRVLLGAAIVFAALQPLHAQQSRPAVCSRLDAQLQAFDRGAGAKDTARDAQLRKLEDLAGSQQTEIDRQENTARRSGCEDNAFFQQFSGQTPQCGPLTKKVQQLRTSLDRTLSDIERLRVNPAPEREGQRRAILVALTQNKCDEQYPPAQVAAPVEAPAAAPVAPPQPAPIAPPTQVALPRAAPVAPPQPAQAAPPRPASIAPPPVQVAAPPPARVPPPARGGLFESLFGPKSVFAPAGDAPASEDASPGGAPEPADTGGSYRTVCVRLCDGYYYPISTATSAGRFGEDEKTCKQSCPASETMLFTYRSSGEDMNQAVSVSTQQAYTALPTAFRYRTALDQACTCKRAGETWSQALKSIEDTTVEQGDIVVNDQRARQLSQPRVDAQGKPIKIDPRANAKPAPKSAQGATPTPAAAAAPPPAPAPADTAADETPSKPDPNRKVRSVGPVFIPSAR
jgi:hypothetical protein